MSTVTARKRPCPCCGVQVRPREVFDAGECPECGADLWTLFDAAGEDPQQLGGITD